jgi:hypothetical protein
VIRKGRPRLVLCAALAGAAILATTGAVAATASTSHPALPTALGYTPGAVGEAGFLPTGKLIQRLTAANMTRFTSNQAQAIALARAYDVIIGTPGEFKSYLPAMRAANHSLVLLGYLNGTFAQRGEANAYPSSWYLRDARGVRVTSKGWGNYAMDPANSGWVSTRVQECARIVAAGYDGCMLDMLGDAPTQPGYLTSLPVNPATHRPYTGDEWLSASSQLGAAVGHAVYPKLVAGNGLGSGIRYFNPAAPSSQLYNGIRAAIGEAWLRAPGAPAERFPTEAVWKANVDALVNAGQRGDALVALTKTWGGGTQAQINAWHLFSLASFLLGTNGTAYYEFSPSNSEAGIMFDSPWEHVNVGLPTSSYAKVGNVYQRTFSQGLALVNPTTSTSRVTLSRPMCDIDGVRQSAVTLRPGGADIFTTC